MKTLVATLLILFTFISCKDEEFYDKEYIQTLSDQYELEQEKIRKVEASCLNASAENRMLTKIVTVNFPAAIECVFNETGVDINDLNEELNGPRQNSEIRARVRQDFQLTIEEDETLCNMDFNFPNQTMQYDDEIFLLLNDYVMISSQNYSESEIHPTGLYTNEWNLQEYSWLGEEGMYGLYGLYYDWNVTERYCLGISNDDPDFNEKCDIPQTESVGEMKLEIPKEEIIKIGALSTSPEEIDQTKNYQFSFITTGDNDNGDCEHAAYSFEVEVTYFQN